MSKCFVLPGKKDNLPNQKTNVYFVQIFKKAMSNKNSF
ncbi:hypothetical protein SAMN05421777_108102 [Fluoribacter gormanii]|uniref:Uncharacterized protein n=1 Tax=Fluoribacter gormanii TaxID=464 RepID=A0A377GLC8_9GAMM|nr:hypothetical protein SAMN05421777_108102 [Fluoribacter gormanii]STO25373.1 Uncharacterised protein [Fluoribacter gormanii]